MLYRFHLLEIIFKKHHMKQCSSTFLTCTEGLFKYYGCSFVAKLCFIYDRSAFIYGLCFFIYDHCAFVYGLCFFIHDHCAFIYGLCTFHLWSVFFSFMIAVVSFMVCVLLGFAKGREVRCPENNRFLVGCRRYRK